MALAIGARNRTSPQSLPPRLRPKEAKAPANPNPFAAHEVQRVSLHLLDPIDVLLEDLDHTALPHRGHDGRVVRGAAGLVPGARFGFEVDPVIAELHDVTRPNAPHHDTEAHS
jgi:hypothetical protein